MRVTGSLSPSQLDLGWGVLSAGCLAIMVAWPSWETIPFHIIWISLTLLYGFRVWSPVKTGAVLAVVAIATGASIMTDAFNGSQLWGELFEVPLMSAMFLAMVWHAKRRMQALAAVARSPISGHRCSSRKNAGSELQLLPFLEDVFMRWAEVAPRAWRLGEVVDVTLRADETWLRAALDALLENAVHHTAEYERTELSAYGEDRSAVIAVSDGGHGIAADSVTHIFERFARSDASRSRREGGAGLGLPIVDAIVRAHAGSCTVRSTLGAGSTFELRLPLLNAAQVDREEAPEPLYVAVPGP